MEIPPGAELGAAGRGFLVVVFGCFVFSFQKGGGGFVKS